MAVLDIQRRGQQIGRIRLGHQVRAANGKMRPERLTTFRFTTPSERTAHAVADLYGGEVRPWEKQFEVITDKSEIDVHVPPRDAVMSQWYEMWGKTIKRRCDSQHEQISGGPCLCPHAEDPDDAEEVDRCARERARLSKMNPPQACGLVTRVNVMIPDLPGLGVWRLDTGSFYAAGESGDKADLMEIAREKNVFLPASLRIEWRVRSIDAKPYPVPVLQILPTFRAIVTGEIQAGVAGMVARLAPAAARPAIAAGPSAAAALPAAGEDGAAGGMTAQYFADLAMIAAERADIEAIIADAAEAGVDGQMIRADEDGTREQLREFLRRRWRELPAASAGAAS